MLTHTFCFKRGSEFDMVSRDNNVAGNAWLIGYTRGALSRGWTLMSIITEDQD